MSRDSNDDDDDDSCLGLGFMFEGAEASVVKRLHWKIPNENDNDEEAIEVLVKVVDDDPGALQSGHYLWPGAPALAEYLLLSRRDNDPEIPPPKSIVELGAGCALLSLTALLIFSSSLDSVVCTDHDPGTLTRAKENYELNLAELRDFNDMDDPRCATLVENVSSVQFHFEPLSWGDVNAANALVSANGSRFDWILGSDLIYCQQVVEPLFISASALLKRDCSKGGKFILSQSFVYDEDTEQEIERMCEKLNLQRIVRVDTLSETAGAGVKIQEFLPLPSNSQRAGDNVLQGTLQYK